MPELLGGLLRSRRAPGSRWSGGCCSARRSCEPPPQPSSQGSAAASRASRRAPGRSTWTPACRRRVPWAVATTPSCCHDAALGLVAGLEVPAVWRLHEDASRGEPDAFARAAGLAERTAGVLVPHESFVPGGNGGAPAALAAGHAPWPRPASTRSILATSSSRRACRDVSSGRSAWTSTGPSASRCSSSIAGMTRTRRSTRSGSPRARARLQLVLAALLDRVDRRLAGRQGDLRLRRGHGRRPSPHHLRRPRQPRGRGAAAARPHRHRALAAAGLRARAIRGALEAHACRGVARRSPSATASTASGADAGQAAERIVGSSATQARDRDGPVRARAGARALPRHRGGRTRAARARG